MNLRKRIGSIVATTAVLMSMSVGVAFAADVDIKTEQAGLNMICPVTNTVALTIDHDFTVDAADGFTGNILGIPYYNSDTIVDNFVVEMDLSCNWSDDFQVRAKIGAFNHDGVVAPAPGTITVFGGSHLYLSSGSGSYVGPNVPFVTGAPAVNPVVFPTILSTEGPMISNGSFWFFDFAAPGVTTASWDGQLKYLPVNLADGHYDADLTVTLSVN